MNDAKITSIRIYSFKLIELITTTGIRTITIHNLDWRILTSLKELKNSTGYVLSVDEKIASLSYILHCMSLGRIELVRFMQSISNPFLDNRKTSSY